MDDEKELYIKLPLLKIAVDILDIFNNENSSLETIFYDKFDSYDMKTLRMLEQALGRYVKYTSVSGKKNLDKLLDSFFPRQDQIKKAVKSIIDGSANQTIDHPIFLHTLCSPGTTHECCDYKKQAAWANLLFDLGLFYIENEEEKTKTNSSALVNYAFLTNNNDYFTLYANIKDNGEIISNVYSRLLVPGAKLIFIDDDKHFGTRHGFEVEGYSLESDSMLMESNNCQGKLYWLYTGRPIDYERMWDHLSTVFDEDHQSVYIFVVDFIYKKHCNVNNNTSKIINTIKGDDVIKELFSRYKTRNMLIVGYTGGDSPFIVNSANKAGADIVVFKGRGETVKTTGHIAPGNPVGLFDLLWAISWNMSVWRSLEECLNIYKKEQNIADAQITLGSIISFVKIFFPSFPDTENCSPFWERYLAEFVKYIGNIELSLLFPSEKRKTNGKS